MIFYTECGTITAQGKTYLIENWATNVQNMISKLTPESADKAAKPCTSQLNLLGFDTEVTACQSSKSIYEICPPFPVDPKGKQRRPPGSHDELNIPTDMPSEPIDTASVDDQDQTETAVVKH